MIRCGVGALKQLAVFVFVVSLIVTGCACGIHLKRIEPSVLKVTNRSRHNISAFTLRIDKKSREGGNRFGTIAPVPMGIFQIYIRPSNPPPLPDSIIVEWVNERGIIHAKKINLKESLKASGENQGGTLVFEIFQDNQVKVYME